VPHSDLPKQRLSIPLILASDPRFPTQISAVRKPPISGLYYKGCLPTQDEILVAIVGTRKAGKTGLDSAFNIARDLARAGVGIVSGLALGIDGAAHAGALEGGGKTYAVLARGLDKVYPASHEQLANKMLESGGGLISEYPPGTEALPRFFLARNRIISALAKAVIVIEAPDRSGALVTARFAKQQNRPIFVVPGAINNHNYAGSHALLKSGATLITCAQDIQKHLGIKTPSQDTKKLRLDISSLAQNQQIILTVLMSSSDPLHIDALCEQTKLDPIVINQELTMLSLEEYIAEDNGRYSAR